MKNRAKVIKQNDFFKKYGDMIFPLVRTELSKYNNVSLDAINICSETLIEVKDGLYSLVKENDFTSVFKDIPILVMSTQGNVKAKAMHYKMECFHNVELVYDWKDEEDFFYIKTV